MTSDNALTDLRHQLGQLHQAAGRPTFRQLSEQAELSGRALPTSTAHELLAGRRRPRWATVETFVIAAAGYAARLRPPVELPGPLVDVWRWRHLYDLVDGPARRQRPAPPAIRPVRGLDLPSMYVGFALARLTPADTPGEPPHHELNAGSTSANPSIDPSSAGS